MGMIQTFNRAVSKAINKDGEVYEALIGDEEFVPESTIVNSEDFNCGGLCNELEYLRTVSDYYVRSFDIDIAEDENLNSLVGAFVDLPRRNVAEEDAVYRRRYRALVNAKSNARRITKWAIIDAIREFGLLGDNIQIVEPFDSNNLFFEVRIEGAVDYESALFMNSVESGFVNQNFVGGSGVGEVITYLGEIVDRLKAVGVDYDVLFIDQHTLTKTIDCIIGSVQKYITVDAVIKAAVSFTKTIDAVIL